MEPSRNAGNLLTAGLRGGACNLTSVAVLALPPHPTAALVIDDSLLIKTFRRCWHFQSYISSDLFICSGSANVTVADTSLRKGEAAMHESMHYKYIPSFNVKSSIGGVISSSIFVIEIKEN
jgi:hypothetical protein